MPLGLVKLKQGTYSVELTSGGTTLTPFKATIKPSSASSSQETGQVDSTFQQLPESNSQPLESTGNAPLPEQSSLITEDDKKNNLNSQSLNVQQENITKSQNQPLETPKTFLTVDQINGQKEVQIQSAAQTQNVQDSGLRTVQIGQLDDNKLSEISGNQPLSESYENFSTNQILSSGASDLNQNTSINNPLVETEKDSASVNNSLPESEKFGLAPDGKPISQNAPLGLNEDGTPITQLMVDQNGMPITGNRPLDQSSETFTKASTLDSFDGNSIQSNLDTITENTSVASDYQKLPEISQADYNKPFVDDLNSGILTGNANEVSQNNQSPQPDITSGFSQNSELQNTNNINISENQKLTESTAFDSKSNNTIENDSTVDNLSNKSDVYQKLPESFNKETENSTQNNDYQKLQNNQIQTSAGGNYPLNNISQSVEQTQTQSNSTQLNSTQSNINTQNEFVAQNVNQNNINSQESNANSQNSINDLDEYFPNNLVYKEGESADYITRSIGNVTETEYQADELVQEKQSRLLSSSVKQDSDSIADSTYTPSINNENLEKSEYVKVGNTSGSMPLSNQIEINNFDIDTDMPSEYYDFKGSRSASNEEIIEEFIKSEQYLRLDEASKASVLSVRQSLQLPVYNPQQPQEQSVTSGTTLAGGKPLEDRPARESRGLGRLFTKNNNQDRTDAKIDKKQDQVQKEFEQVNGLKQKISLTLNKVFGNNEKTSDYIDIERQQINNEEAGEFQNNINDEENQIIENDYQFGDEDKVYTSPRITGVREALDEEYQEELKKRRRRKRNLKYLPVGADLQPKFFSDDNDKVFDGLPDDEESNLYRQFTSERDRFQNLTLSEQEQNKIALRKAEHDIQQELNKALEENVNIKEAAENQASEAVADSESVFYKELIKERERFQQALLEEREQNKAALRRSEDQIQRQLIDVLTANPQAAPTQSPNDPIAQVVRSLVDSGKDKEEIIIDATRIIQMIQNNQTESGGQEIDEYLLRQRIERELKYEFKQMQIEHEQKMKLIYRRMIEDMYIDMLNS